MAIIYELKKLQKKIVRIARPLVNWKKTDAGGTMQCIALQL